MELMRQYIICVYVGLCMLRGAAVGLGMLLGAAVISNYIFFNITLRGAVMGVLKRKE